MSASFTFTISDRVDITVDPIGHSVRAHMVAQREVLNADLTFTADEARALAKALRRAARYAT